MINSHADFIAHTNDILKDVKNTYVDPMVLNNAYIVDRLVSIPDVNPEHEQRIVRAMNDLRAITNPDIYTPLHIDMRNYVNGYCRFTSEDWVTLVPMTGFLKSIWSGQFNKVPTQGKFVDDEHFMVVVEPYNHSENCVVELS